jgi:hypothetical protein
MVPERLSLVAYLLRLTDDYVVLEAESFPDIVWAALPDLAAAARSVDSFYRIHDLGCLPHSPGCR